MADLSYTVAIEATGAQSTLAKLNKQVEGLNTTFGALKTALAGIAFGSMIASANKFADAIGDMSDVTGIAINTIMGFNAALMQNGGDAEAATSSIGKFTQAVGDAIGGSNSAQKAFADIGVSLKDIQTLSNEDLLKKSVDGLAGLESSAKRITTQVALFGKSSRTVNFGNVSNDMGPAAESARKYAEAIKSGAAAQQSLEVNMKNMTTALLQVIKPLNDIVSTLNVSVGAFESLFKMVLYAGGAFLIFGKALPFVKTVMDALAVTVKGAGGLFALLMLQFTRMGSALTSVALGIGRAIGVVAGGTSAAFSFAAALAAIIRFLLRFAGLVGIVMAVAEAVNFLSKQFFDFDIIDFVIEKFGALYDAAKKFFGLGGGNDDTQKNLKAQQEQVEKTRKEYEEAQEKAKEFADRQAKLAEELSKTSREYKNVNIQQLQRLALEKELIGVSEDQKELIMAQEDLYDRQKSAIDALIEKRREWANGSEEQKASIGLIDQEIAKIKELSTVQSQQLPKYISQLQVAKILEQDRLRIFEEMNKQMERQALLADQLRGANDKMVDVKFESSQRGKSPLEQQFAQIREDARKAALEAGRAFSAAFEDGGDGLSSDKAKELADGLAQIADRYKQIADVQIENAMAARTFEDGWTQAFNAYADSATNAAKRAGDLFNAVTSNMERAIDNFVDNGKFSFGDFASSLIKDMIKIELKASAMNLMKMMGGAGGGGGGGFFSSIGSLLGFADGGNPPIGRASVVGENGPELIVPRTASTVIPNTGGGGQNITNNYYTVNAIDAKSVAQLFSENRKTLLGSVKMAEKEMPYKMR